MMPLFALLLSNALQAGKGSHKVLFFLDLSFVSESTQNIVNSILKENQCNQCVFFRGITHQLPHLIDSSNIIYTIAEDQHKCQGTK